MRALPIFAVLAAFVGLAAGVAAQPQGLVDRFERRTIDSNGLTMSYGLFVPDGYDPDVAYPLVVAFHGLGESGTDLANLERHRLATSWADPARQARHPAIVLAPQTLQGRRWTTDTDPDVSDFTAVQLAVLDLLALVQSELSVDPDRVYAVGLSLGGHATWDFVSRQPGRWAAAVPMSGRGFVSQADDLGGLPVWAFTGEQDGTVPASQTRRVVQTMEDLGRDVIYTHCRRSPVEARAFDCPGFTGRDSLQAAVDAHADLVYWSEPNTGHSGWAGWFDNELMADWLFSKVRRDADAIALTAPSAGARLSGEAAVTWTSPRTTPDTVEVWLNRTPDADGWTKLGEAPISAGAFALDTETIPDAARARVRLFVRDADGRIVGRTTGGRFALDNAGNAPPELRLRDERLRFDPVLTEPMYSIAYTAADAEGDELSGAVLYSRDGGRTYSTVSDFPPEALNPNGDDHSVTVDLRTLPNATEARLRVDLTDGESTVSAETPVFRKETPRDGSDGLALVARVAGEGAGTVEARVVDAAALTGADYRITIAVADDGAKTFSVADGERVLLDGVPFSDGFTESPVFDGLVLVVADPAEPTAGPATGWVEGDTDLGVVVTGTSVRLGILTVGLLGTEDDYTLTVADGVVGRSVERYRIPAADLRFSVTAASDGAERPVVFDDDDGDGLPSDGDALFVLEPSADGGGAEPAWHLAFAGGTEPAEPGDAFLLSPVRGLGPDDVFQVFLGPTPSTEPESVVGPTILGRYPNPTLGPVTVAYRLAAPAAVTVEVFDALGRRVASLDAGAVGAGDHRATWDGAGAAAGLYVVRLTADAGAGAVARAEVPVVHIGR